MPTFGTPGPITLTLTAQIADVRLLASARTDTVVTITPRDPDDPDDVRAADGTRVDHVPADGGEGGGRVDVRSPVSWRRFSPRHTDGAVCVQVELPAGSALRAEAGVVEVHATGELGDCAVTASMGDLAFDRIGTAALSTNGRLTVSRIGGAATLKTAGAVRIGEVHGQTRIENINGTTVVDVAAAPVHVRAANGDVTVGVGLSDVQATTANGDLTVDDVVRGRVDLETSFGRVEVGIRSGTAARLDVRSRFGRVRNGLDATDGPGTATDTAEVRARTSAGDIVLRRPAATTS